ncbi:hypothetical protein C8T65DRAFT_694434 [Cerioporus squamosus]|nr:hypothetical protein C8T65DRAFT_694434 [Cerioporus squamosus]
MTDTSRSKSMNSGKSKPSYVVVDAAESRAGTETATLRQHSPKFTSKLSKTWHRFYPVLPLVYAGHVWLRRRMPRVLPRFTTLRLWELYASWGLYSALTTETRHMQTQWIRDRDLATIELGAYVFWRDNHPTLHDIQKLKFRKDTLQRLDFYPRREEGVLAELKWWNDHIWSSEQTWKGVALILDPHVGALEKLGWVMPQGETTREDWDRIITFLANAIHGKNGTTNPNLAFPVLQVFACLTPFAMLARHIWVRATPVLWFNGLQRMLFYAAAYLGSMQEYQFYRYSASIQQKEKFAQLLCHALPGLDKAVDELIRVSLPDHV